MTLTYHSRRNETFIFRYDSRRALLRQLGRMAANPDLAFHWYDAARVTAQAHRLHGQRVEFYGDRFQMGATP